MGLAYHASCRWCQNSRFWLASLHRKASKVHHAGGVDSMQTILANTTEGYGCQGRCTRTVSLTLSLVASIED